MSDRIEPRSETADALEVRSYLRRLLDAGINVPTAVSAAAERILMRRQREDLRP